MTTKDLYLQSIDHCKMFAPIAEELGIEPDGWHRSITNDDWFFTPREDQDPTKLTTDHCINIPTWRQDKLELPLPEPPYTLMDRGDVCIRAYELCIDIMKFTGEPKRQATVDLVCLLEEEGLL